MSAVKELAELEAAIAEHELSDAEVEQLKADLPHAASFEVALSAVLAARKPQKVSAEDELAAELAAGEPSEKRLRALERENERHAGKVFEIMGPFVDGFEPCHTCDGLALEPPGPKPQTHEYFKRCEVCLGYGEVLTGSMRDGNTSRNCPGCGGRGYVEALDQNGTPLADRGVGSAAAAPIPTAPPASLPATGGPEQQQEVVYGTPSWMGDPSLAPQT